MSVKIRVLGCHGSDQLVDRDLGLHQCRTCGFLINETVLVDAGTVGPALRLDEQKRIRHVLLSHLHFDHIQGLPTLADNLVDEVVEPVVLTTIPVNHPVPTVGFFIREGQATFLYSGDTYVTEEIWARAARTPTLKAALIETSFPDAMAELARVSMHLTPSLFAREFRKIGRPDLPVYVYHLKPRFREQIRRELAQLKIPNLTVLEEGQEITI